MNVIHIILFFSITALLFTVGIGIIHFLSFLYFILNYLSRSPIYLLFVHTHLKSEIIFAQVIYIIEVHFHL